MLQRPVKALEKFKMELEYNEDLDEHFIVIPESMLRRLDWEEGDMLDYDLEEEVIRIFKI
jgi:hypothetical protein